MTKLKGMKAIKGQYLVVLLFVALLNASGCFSGNISSDKPEILFKDKFDKSSGIAVLNFSRESSSPSGDIGRLTAEKLSDAMFLRLGYKTIERSRISESLKYMGINSPESLSLDEIQKLGLRLKADYLLLGRVRNSTGENYLSDDCDKNLAISFRIVSVLNGDIVALGSYSSDYKGDVSEKIDEMVNAIVHKIKAGEDVKE